MKSKQGEKVSINLFLYQYESTFSILNGTYIFIYYSEISIVTFLLCFGLLEEEKAFLNPCHLIFLCSSLFVRLQ